ncbi:MAG: hypothetical protein HQK83_07710 [Fibrobacteria bacterium]|nr:hypothetical protein [Fibrobacteria bacterium]
MNLILTMAGRYSRFINEGYKLPKFLLPWGDRTIVAVILTELMREKKFKQVFLVANKRDEIYMPHIRCILDKLGISRDNLILIQDTDGQAETAAVGVEFLLKCGIKKNEPIVFHNIDTILYNRNISEAESNLAKYDGFIDVFNSNNRTYSYVLKRDDGFMETIAEKMVISNLATSGFYGFKSSKTYLEFYKKGKDMFISAVYKNMTDKGCKIAISNIHNEHDTLVLGTPAEYVNLALGLDEI